MEFIDIGCSLFVVLIILAMGTLALSPVYGTPREVIARTTMVQVESSPVYTILSFKYLERFVQLT